MIVNYESAMYHTCRSILLRMIAIVDFPVYIYRIYIMALGMVAVGTYTALSAPVPHR